VSGSLGAYSSEVKPSPDHTFLSILAVLHIWSRHDEQWGGEVPGGVVSLLPTLLLILRQPDGTSQEATLLEQQPLGDIC
jgi:hypothetical protein